MDNSKITDRSIIQQVQNKFSGRGLSAPCRVAVNSQNGQVTLTGTVAQAHQKALAVQLASAITGVRRVIDQLTIKAVAKY